MRYYVKQGEREWAVDVTRLSGERMSVTLDGTPTEVTVLAERPTLVVAVGGRVVELFPSGADGVALAGAGDGFRVESGHARALSRSSGEGRAAGTREIRAPMPGRVVKVLVALGDAVCEGSGLLVIEAMKMENELDARAAGTVAGIFVQPGDVVDRGALLVSLA
jgi:acetyl/propionyl-CoA carboxylase alpha subunit